VKRFNSNFSEFWASHKSVLRAIILVAALSLICLSAVEIAFSWKTDRYVSHASAVYITLANDLADGTFLSDLFWGKWHGGTRYFPLYFFLTSNPHQGLYINHFLEPLAASVLLIASMLGNEAGSF